MLAIDILTTDKSRVFLAPSGANSLTLYDYHNSMVLGGLSKTFGEAENVTIPHPTKYRKFVTVDKIVTANSSNWTSSLIGRFFLKKQSLLMKMAKCESDFDLQCHFGQCVDPTDFNTFDLAVILEDARINDYNTDPLGTLDQSGVAAVNETVAVSAQNVYYIYNRPFIKISDAILSTGAITDLVLNKNGDCTEGCDDCKEYFGIKIPSTLVGTDICIVYSQDNGVTWGQATIDTNADLATYSYTTYKIATDGTYVYAFLNETSGDGHMYKIQISQIIDDSVGTPSFTTLNSTVIYDVFNEGKTIIAVGENAIVQKINGNALTSEVISNNIFTDTLHAVHGLSTDHFITGGEGGLLLEYKLGTGFRKVTIIIPGPTTITETITSLCMKNENEWLIGTHAGTIYITLNAGRTWTLAYQFSSCISDIVFPTKNVGYITIKEVGIFRSIDGGASWIELEAIDTLDDTVALMGIVPCDNDPSKYLAYGVLTTTAFDPPCNTTNEFIPTASETGIIYIPQED
jgi:hypothetical protein